MRSVWKIGSKVFWALFISSLCLSGFVNAASKETGTWGIGAVFRQAYSPFVTEYDAVTSFVPMLFYDNGVAYLEGTHAGVKLWNSDKQQLSFVSKLRFFDIPFEYQNAVQGDTFDFGFTHEFEFSNHYFLTTAFMSDLDGRTYGELFLNSRVRIGSAATIFKVGSRLKSQTFNSHYFALNDYTNEEIGSGNEIIASVSLKYPISLNWHLLSALNMTWLDSEAKGASLNRRSEISELFLGIGYLNQSNVPKNQFDFEGYWRVAHGWATPSNLGDILLGASESDIYNNQLSSLFVGIPLAKQVNELPLDVYLTTGLAWHWDSDVQEQTEEFALAIKGYYTFGQSLRARLGIAEGVSFINDVTYIESSELFQKGYRTSQMMNFIDVSFDLNIGDVFDMEQLRSFWVGYSIHHRSSIFETAQQFGRIKGGSNYNTIYLQIDF